MSPLPPRSAAEQQRLNQILQDLFEQRITFNTVIGLRIGPDSLATLQFEMRPELIGHYLHGRLHGGVISTALDTVGSLALMRAIADKHAHESTEQILSRFARMGTIDLRVDFLRQGLGRSFTASAEVTRVGGRIGSTQMRLHNEEGLLIATGAATYVIS
jgi:uncharacterized protein (TIGR00369 family)